MDTASILVRAALLLASAAAVAGSAVELTVTSRLESNFEANQAYCRSSLCDETTVATYAYNQQLQGDRGSVEEAVKILRGVVIRDPASAERWIDLGEAFAAAGSARQARLSMARAIALGDTSADVLIPAGNFYLISGDRVQGIQYLSRALDLTPMFDPVIFSYFSAQKVEAAELRKDGVLDDRRVAQAYLRYALSQGDLSNAQPAWQGIEAHNFSDPPMAIEYVNFLVAHARFREAAEVWTIQFGYREPGYAKTEYIYDGDFASEPIAGGYFDWRITPADNVEIVREPVSGVGALRIQFDGTANLDFRNISQRTVLPPGKYRFRARVRAENITTDQGVYFRIADTEDPNRLSIETAPELRTSDWHTVESTFVSGPGTRVIEVSVNRRPSLRFDNKISGTIWIEGLSLAPL